MNEFLSQNKLAVGTGELHPRTWRGYYTACARLVECFGRGAKQLGEILPKLKESLYGPYTVCELVDTRIPFYSVEDYTDPESTAITSGAAGGWDFRNMDMHIIAFVKQLNRDQRSQDGHWQYAAGCCQLPRRVWLLE